MTWLLLAVVLAAPAAAVWATRRASTQDAVADDGLDIFGEAL